MSQAAESGYRMTSISRRFSYLLIGIVTILLMVFSAIVVSYHIRVIDADLNARLESAISFAQKSLPTPLWNLDHDVVRDVIEALFLNESVVYTTVYLDDRIIVEKSRLQDQALKNNGPDPSRAGSDKSLITRETPIFHEDNKVGTILIQMTREKHRRQLMYQIYGISALTLVIISAIWITTLLMTRRYITNPLKRLQDSAAKIALGQLDAFVDQSGDDEIGMLARHLDRMRSAIKKLFHELRESKDKLEEYSRTLEKKVENRTRALERSVAELKALSEVSQSVSSTLDLEKVLNNIVRHAVKLSKTDAGTIYEYHEDNRRIIHDLLTAHGFDVVEAVTGLEGVRAAQRQNPALILMDIQLPEIDGYEATRRIKSQPDLKHIPIIIITSYALSGDDLKAYAAGCDAYVSKPYSPRKLLTEIRKFLTETPAGEAR